MTEEQRFSQDVARQKNEHDLKLRELANAQGEEVTATIDRYKKEKTEIEKSFTVSLSEESRHQAERLEDLRKNHTTEYESEKKKLDAEFEKMNVRERARVDNYQKKQEENLTKLHDRYQIAQDELRKQNSDT